VAEPQVSLRQPCEDRAGARKIVANFRAPLQDPAPWLSQGVDEGTIFGERPHRLTQKRIE
jgi:hypothetical protein